MRTKSWIARICASLALAQSLLVMGCGRTSTSHDVADVEVKQGALCCEHPVWDAGEVERLALLLHTYTITNNSTLDVSLKEVRSTCGCFVPKLPKLHVAPGESFDVPVQFQVPPAPGNYRRSVYVDVVAPEAQVLELSVACEVTADAGLYAEPNQIDFGTTSGGTAVKRKIVVTRFDHSPVRFRSFSVDKGAITLTSDVAPIPGSAGNRVELCFDPASLPPGETPLKITVHTDSRKPHDVLEIPASIRISGRPSFVASIYIPNLGESESREIPLSDAASQKSCQIREWRYSGDGRLQISVINIEAPGQPMVRVSFSPNESVPSGTIITGQLDMDIVGRKDAVQIPLIVARRSK